MSKRPSKSSSPRTGQANSESEVRLRAILDTAVDAIVTIDEHGTLLSVNRAFERLFGYAAEEVRGQNVSILMPSPYREEHDSYIAQYLKSGEAKIIGIGREVVAKRKDNSVFPIDLAVSEVELGSERIFTGIIHDISNRKQVEQELRQQRDFAESLIETAQAAVLVLDPDGKIVRFNPYFEELTGYSLERLRGRDWFSTFVPDDQRNEVQEEFRQVLAGNPTRGFTNSILDQGKELHEIAWFSKVLTAEDGSTTGVLAVGHDMTKLKDAQAQLMQSERLAAIGQMVAGLAHESRNALQRSQACLEMLELEIEDNEEAMDQVNRIRRAQEDLNRLFNEVRSYAGPLKLDVSECTLAALWKEAWNLVLRQRSGRDAELVEKIETTDLKCSVDHFRVVQVFRNLFENALAACSDPVRIEITCADETQVVPDGLRVTVCDNGPGIPAHSRGKVFEPFFTTKAKGTGLGMPIARRISEAHGGQLLIGESPQEEGAQFILILPRTVE